MMSMLHISQKRGRIQFGRCYRKQRPKFKCRSHTAGRWMSTKYKQNCLNFGNKTMSKHTDLLKRRSCYQHRIVYSLSHHLNIPSIRTQQYCIRDSLWHWHSSLSNTPYMKEHQKRICRKYREDPKWNKLSMPVLWHSENTHLYRRIALHFIQNCFPHHREYSLSRRLNTTNIQIRQCCTPNN